MRGVMWTLYMAAVLAWTGVSGAEQRAGGSATVGRTSYPRAQVGVRSATVSGQTQTQGADVLNGLLRASYPVGARAIAAKGLQAGADAYEVRDARGSTIGWMFRTDRVGPQVRGYRNAAEIGVLVALSKDGKVLNVEPVSSPGETPKYFARLTGSFYRQFQNRDVRSGARDVQAVTGATVSSSAVIRDVFSSSETILAGAPQPSTPTNPAPTILNVER